MSHQINNLLPGLVNISIVTRPTAVSQLDSITVYDITMHCLQNREREGVGGAPLGDSYSKHRAMYEYVGLFRDPLTIVLLSDLALLK